MRPVSQTRLENQSLIFSKLVSIRDQIGIPSQGAAWGFSDPHVQELKVWNSFIYLSHRHAFNRMPMLPERLLDPLKNLSLSAILLRVTEKHAAFW